MLKFKVLLLQFSFLMVFILCIILVEGK
jgi:hypothetical protein